MMKPTAVTEPRKQHNAQDKSLRRGRGRGRGRGAGGRQNARGGSVTSRPTHFLALPLHTHADLRSHISAFQDALFVGPDTSPNVSLGTQASVNQISPDKGKKKVTKSSIVDGLDTSIVIDPHRLHMTLGVMSLYPDDAVLQPPTTTIEDEAPAPDVGDTARGLLHLSPTAESTKACHTVSSALSLLRSLQPQISAILAGSKGVDIPLEVLDVMKTSRIKTSPPGANSGSRPPEEISEVDVTESPRTELNVVRDDKVGAGVLFVGPRDLDSSEESEERRKLREICELVFRTFKDAGYITDTRPLKLHCTILNASHRKLALRAPFSYTDIRAASDSLSHLTQARRTTSGSESPAGPLPTDPVSPSLNSSLRMHKPGFSELAIGLQPQAQPAVQPRSSPNPHHTSDHPPRLVVPPPLPIMLGDYHVEEIQLCVMGSRGSNNEYVSCGGVRLE